MLVRRRLWTGQRLEWAAAGGGVLLALTLALWPSHWPFDARPPGRDSSVWQFLLSDRVTLGFVRLSVVLLSLFVIASVPALFAAGRWLKGFGVSGVAADESQSAAALAREVEKLQQEIQAMKGWWDEVLRAADAGGSTTVDGSGTSSAQEVQR